MKTAKTFRAEIGGQPFSAEFSDMAGRADGAVLVRHGETAVLVAAVMGSAKEHLDYFPLSVEYEERFYAAGMILGSRFMRREGRPSDAAVLNARLVDRAIRPLFNHEMRNEVQVVVTALSIDEANDPDVAAIVGASLALASSRIPWDGPIAAMRVGQVDGAFVINPSYAAREGSTLDLILCSKKGKILMMEAGVKEVPEDVLLGAIAFALPELEKIEKFQRDIVSEIGKQKMTPEIPEMPAAVTEAFHLHIRKRLEEALFIKEREERDPALAVLKAEWMDIVSGVDERGLPLADGYLETMIDKIVHENVLERDRRVDERPLQEVRELYAQVGLLPRAHGSGLFYRGETHILTIATLGPPGDAQLIEGMEIRTKKRFMHHYNFPPYSVGETKPMRGPGRREIGHGALAERALEPMLPSKEEFPYTIRLVSETLSSNGSSSMGSTCASTLALMDAGVPIKNPVAGIAMGIMIKDDNTYKVLTDIQGPEDHYGDMDLKVAGTADGITAIQMDVKVDGVTLPMLKDAFAAAREARLHILDTLRTTLPAPRSALSPYAPRVVVLEIDPEKIRDVVGPGGRVINAIIAETGTEIDIEQTGKVYITGRNGNGNMEKAVETIKNLTRTFAAGEEFDGTVTRIFEFGAMVEIAPKQEGLIHISKLIPGTRVPNVTDVLNVGEAVRVRIEDIDELGRLNLVPAQNLKVRELGSAPRPGAGGRPAPRHSHGNNRGNYRPPHHAH